MFYSPKLIRFVFTGKQEFNLDFSYAVAKGLNQWKEISYKKDEDNQKIILSTDDLVLEISKKPFKLNIYKNSPDKLLLCQDDDKLGIALTSKSFSIRSYKKIREHEHFYGFGEKTGPLDKKGQYMIMHGKDMPYKGDIDPMYQNHPFFISISKGVAYGIFLDNISKTSFDMGNTNPEEYYFEAETGDLNYYFMYGPTMDEILELYTELTGRMDLPPKWTIGYQQCRYSYRNEKEITEITSKFRETKIPCDVIWFDIHYMNQFRVFTFDKKRFPDPPGLINKLKNQGFHSVCIVDPGVKVDPDYSIYQELIKNSFFTPSKNGEPSIGLVWPGLTNFPDFTREDVRSWWAEKHKFYFDLGIDGIWNDMNEPAISINPILSKFKRFKHDDMYFDDQGRKTHHDHAKNVYGLCQAMATHEAFKMYLPDKRPFILTRSGYSGVQKYAALWTGDNWGNFYNITLAVRILLGLNLSAQSFVGSDIAGHAGILKYILHDKKQFIRWIQTGVFYPFCRIHTTFRTKQQDPFSYGKKAQKIAKKYIELRYELFPYWYTLFHEYCTKGKPILRPLFYDSPKNETCHDEKYQHQFFLGRDLLIIPIDKRRIKKKKIYLPKGTWINYWNLQELEGNREHLISITLNDIPIFIRKGAIILTQGVLEFVNQKPISTLILKIYRGNNGSTTSTLIYEDDGESMDYVKKKEFVIYNLTSTRSDDKIKISIKKAEGNYIVPWKMIKCEIFDNGKMLSESTHEFNNIGLDIVV